MAKTEKTMEALLNEGRTFSPSKHFRENAHVNDEALYRKAKRNREKYWEDFTS
ncbi:MAG: hypothetical protein ACERKJ_06365 [Candidatus Dadabacteria bacterium]